MRWPIDGGLWVLKLPDELFIDRFELPLKEQLDHLDRIEDREQEDYAKTNTEIQS